MFNISICIVDYSDFLNHNDYSQLHNVLKENIGKEVLVSFNVELFGFTSF